MNVTYPTIKTIFDTLPIGYYLGRNITTELSETSDTSAFFPFEDKIIISYPSIAAAVEAMPAITNDELESIVRGLLYHEISHVIFTSNSLLKFFRKEHEVINVFEDERIETLCRNVYMNVDFKRNLFILNNGVSEPESSIMKFFNLVRFRIGDDYWLDRVNEIINSYADVTAISEEYQVRKYGQAVVRLYNDFIREEASKAANPDKSSENDDKQTDSGNSQGSATKTSENKEQENTDGSKSGTSADNKDARKDGEKNTTECAEHSNSDGTSEHSDNESGAKSSANKADAKENSDNTAEGTGKDLMQKTLDEIKDKMKSTAPISIEDFKHEATKLFSIYFDESLNSKLTNVVINKLRQNKQNGSAICSYSGRLNPRSVGTRDDYRWWTQQNRSGHIKQFSKVHFNLFIDNSGSFWANDKPMNKFIQILDKIACQHNDFTFDVITINTKVVEWPNHHRQFMSDGGNKLLHTIKDVIRRHQKPACNTYNIVLFDGDAHSDDEFGRLYTSSTFNNDPFRHFDTANTIIVTDRQNKYYIDRSEMHSATIRYCHNYCEEFINTICDLLERAI